MKTALITGASRGIGKAIAAEFSQRNWELFTPGRAELDLADGACVDRFCKGLTDRKVDVLVNNAGINHLAAIAEITDAQCDEMLAVNVTAPRKLMQAVAPAMIAQGWGRIVNISSIASGVTRARRGAYSMTKAAINSLTRSAAIEFGPHGILVNAVCPGFIETDMTRANNDPAALADLCRAIPMGRLGTAEDIAKVVGFLCSEENSYLTGQSIFVDGGFTCI